MGFLMLDFFFAIRYYLDTLLDQNQAPAAHLCLLIPCSYISITPEVPPFSPEQSQSQPDFLPG